MVQVRYTSMDVFCPIPGVKYLSYHPVKLVLKKERVTLTREIYDPSTLCHGGSHGNRF